MTKLTLKEQKILWTVLNQAQRIGLEIVSKYIDNLEPDLNKKSFKGSLSNNLRDWIEQTIEEYDVLNSLKVKLCGDLE